MANMVNLNHGRSEKTLQIPRFRVSHFYNNLWVLMSYCYTNSIWLGTDGITIIWIRGAYTFRLGSYFFIDRVMVI